MRHNLPSIFDAFNTFDNTFRYLRKMDDAFNSFFDELYVEPEYVNEYKGERDTYINGMLVKKEKSDGTIEYYQNGRLHNLSGPAVSKKEGDSEYWIDGRQVSKIDHEKAIKDIEASKKNNYKLDLTDDEKKKVEDALGRKLGK